MRALRMDACQLAHRRSDWARDLRSRLLVRSNLVRTRVRVVVQLRTLFESRGYSLPSCSVETLHRKIEASEIDEGLGIVILPLVTHLLSLNELIKEEDAEMAVRSKASEVSCRFVELPGIGTLTSLAFMAAIEDPRRFSSARQVASYLGFVPREYSSGERVHRGATTKNGDKLTRAYLVQAGWRVMRSTKEEAVPLRDWALALKERRGSKIAVTALARRLSRILFALWRDGTHYDATKLPR